MEKFYHASEENPSKFCRAAGENAGKKFPSNRISRNPKSARHGSLNQELVVYLLETMKSNWSNFHQIARNSFIAASAVYVSTEFNFSNTSLPDRRSFCYAAGGRSSFIELKSEEEFNNALRKAQDGSLPSVFYFTAAWCGPCRLISPVILELSKKYPDVTTYKVDIYEDGLSNAIGKLNVSAVPTMHFFKGGVKKAEIVGVDVVKLKSLMEHLYK